MASPTSSQGISLRANGLRLGSTRPGLSAGLSREAPALPVDCRALRPCHSSTSQGGAQAPLAESASPQSLHPGHIVFVVNPRGNNGSTYKQWKQMREVVLQSLGPGFTVEEALTEYPFHAAQLAKEAKLKGSRAVIAVGGDGTLHEVANGLFFTRVSKPQGGAEFQSPEPTATALGAIPLGTGCDFARTLGWRPNDPLDAAKRLACGRLKVMSVGRAKLPLFGMDRIFLNVASVHFTASVANAASERFKFLGPLCYSVAVVTEFPKHKNQDLLIRADGDTWQTLEKVTCIAVGNAKFFGGGIQMIPGADPFSPLLDLVALRGFVLRDFILHLRKLYAGTHLSVSGVSSQRIRVLDIVDPLAQPGGDSCPAVLSKVGVEADGEYLGTLPVQLSIEPSAISLIV